MHAFDYLEPVTVAEACAMLADHGPRARPLAGGTDLLIQMEMGKVRPEAVVHLGRIEALRGIEWDPQAGLRISAGVTLREVETHPIIRERYPALATAAQVVGSVQIRNLGTLVGNLCNASPSADTSPALLALDGQVEIASPTESFTIPVAEFWTGPGQMVLQPGQLVTGVRLPVPTPSLRTWYYKLAVRKAMDLAMVGVCVALEPRNGSARRVRIALGAVAPTCLRARHAEQLAEQGEITNGCLEAIAEAAVAATSPISDQRASADYRRAMVGSLTRRAFTQLLR
ncbi:MAG: xanthine dehydrogenase family protein subunit M [Armatimonadetes bacterium]|nr:xanthine dehydrogenase family protein subunit M [Armatimonadota bacterium]